MYGMFINFHGDQIFVDFFEFLIHDDLCNSYNMGTWGLPDLYPQALGPATLGLGYIYQANPKCPCYN